MSGHSKWANIKNRKGAVDKKRSEVFTKVSKDILTALRTGVGMKTAIDKAREVNMPKENIERLIARFEERRAAMGSYVFEGFGPLGVPVVVEVETDNKNRVLGEIKFIFKENGGALGESGSVGFLFDRVGEVEVEALPEEKELELIDAGAIDFDGNIILTNPEDRVKMEKRVKEMGLKTVRTELVMRPKSPVMLGSEDEVSRIMDLVDSLEENDDVVNVFAGFDLKEK